MTRRLATSSVAVLGVRLFTILAGLLTTVVIARALGPEGVGTYVAIVTVVTIVITLADLGIRQAVTYTMGQNAFDRDDIIGTLLLLLLVSSTLGIAFCAAIYLTGPARAYGAALIPALVAVPLLLTTIYAKGVSLANGWIGRFNTATVVERFTMFAVLVVLLGLVRMDLLGATLAYAVGAAVGAAYSLAVMRSVARLRPRWRPEVAKRLLSLGAVYAATLFILTLNYRIDILLLERMVAASDVGLYGVGVRLAELIWQLPSAIGVVLFSESARSEGDEVAVDRTTHVLRVTLPVAIVACGLLALVAPFVLGTVFGPVFRDAASVVRWLMPGIAAAILFKILNADLAGRGRPRHAFWIYAFVVVLNIALNLALIPHYGIDGAAFASSVAYLVGGVWFALSYARLHARSVRSVVLARPSDFAPLVRAVRARLGRRGDR